MVQLGGILCEFIGLISFTNFNACTKGFMLLLFIVLFPLVILFLSLVLGGVAATLFCQLCRFMPLINRFSEAGLLCINAFEGAGNQFIRAILFIPILVFKIGFYIFIIALYLAVAAIWTTITFIVGALAFTILIVPCYLMLLFLLCRKFYTWSKLRQRQKRQKRQHTVNDQENPQLPE